MKPVPMPPPIDKAIRQRAEKPGELTENEANVILTSHLNAKDRDNPVLLKFIESYIRCRNIAQASEEAGVLLKKGKYWRNRADVAMALNKLAEKSANKYGFDATDVMERVKEIVDFDPICLERPDGTYIKSMREIPAESRRVLKELTVKNIWGEHQDLNGMTKKIIIGEIISYKFYDKNKSIELMGKEKELFKTTTKHEHDLTSNMAEVLLASSTRAAERKAQLAGDTEEERVIKDVTPVEEGKP